MVVAIKMSALSTYPKNAVFASPKCLRSRFVDLTCCLHKTSLTFRLPSVIDSSKRIGWYIKSSADGGGRLDPPPTGSGSNGETRLVRALRDFQIKLNVRFKELRKGFPMKILFFLVGFYCATAFATVIGQTGDWDILSAGLAVFVVEGVGALMYRTSFPVLGKIKSLITMFNYWKAGLSMGLFLDAFKYEMDNIFGLRDPFSFEIDILPPFL